MATLYDDSAKCCFELFHVDEQTSLQVNKNSQNISFFIRQRHELEGKKNNWILK